MKRILIITAYSILVTVLLLLAGYRENKNATTVRKTDYSALWNMEQAKEVPAPQTQPAVKHKEIMFKDKSMGKGVDAAPSVSAG
jgi:hypothetical protein